MFLGDKRNLVPCWTGERRKDIQIENCKDKERASIEPLLVDLHGNTGLASTRLYYISAARVRKVRELTELTELDSIVMRRMVSSQNIGCR